MSVSTLPPNRRFPRRRIIRRRHDVSANDSRKARRHFYRAAAVAKLGLAAGKSQLPTLRTSCHISALALHELALHVLRKNHALANLLIPVPLFRLTFPRDICRSQVAGASNGGTVQFPAPAVVNRLARKVSIACATDPAVRDEVISVPTAPRYSPAGFYPSAYRISYDAAAKEYHVALTQLARHE